MIAACPRAGTVPWTRSEAPATDLDEVFTLYFDRVHRFLYTRVGNREDAEDLTSEVFLKASHYLETHRAELSVASWIFTTARTVLADHWRRHYRRGPMVSLDAAVLDVPEVMPVEGSTDRAEQLVSDVLGLLPDRYRLVLELRFLRGYSIEETASEMSVTPGNAKVLQHRALAKAVELAEEPQPV